MISQGGRRVSGKADHPPTATAGRSMPNQTNPLARTLRPKELHARHPSRPSGVASHLSFRPDCRAQFFFFANDDDHGIAQIKFAQKRGVARHEPRSRTSRFRTDASARGPASTSQVSTSAQRSTREPPKQQMSRDRSGCKEPSRDPRATKGKRRGCTSTRAVG